MGFSLAGGFGCAGAAAAAFVDGAKLLQSALFWGSTLDATSPDRVADRLNFGSAGNINASVISGQPDDSGGNTAQKVIPAAGTWNANQCQSYPTAVTGFTVGVRTHVAAICRADDGMLDDDATHKAAFVMSNFGHTDTVMDFTFDRTGAGAGVGVWPTRSLFFKRSDGWLFVARRFAWVSNTNSPRLAYPQTTGSVVNGVDGISISRYKYYQSPLATLPNRASGGAVASVADETTAPELERGDIYPDQQLYAWPDATRAIDFAGLAAEKIDISAVPAAISGPDHDATFTFAWRPMAVARANAEIFAATGSTASLKLIYLTTGYLRLTRVADDGTSISVDFDRKLGLVPHAFSVVISGGVASVYSQGQLWGTSKTFTSGKVATFTAFRIGGSEFVGKYAEIAIASSAWTAQQVAAVHATLCVRRSLPVGARETWLLNGQSNSETNGQGWTAPTWTPLSGSRGVHFEYAYEGNTFQGWGVARAFAQDKRQDDYNAGVVGAYNLGFHNFGSEATLHAARQGIATIRVSRGGVPVEYWAPGGSMNTTLHQQIDMAIEEAGVPLSIRGLIMINGESDTAAGVDGYYYDHMQELTNDLATSYGGPGFVAIARKLPLSYGHGANPTGVARVQAETDQWVAIAPTVRASINMDDMLDSALYWDDYPTNVHGGTPQRWQEGLRFASVISELI